MDKKMLKTFAYKAIEEMRAKLRAYEQKPDANSMYVQKNKSYIDAIHNYISSLESELQDMKFNAEFIFYFQDEDNKAGQLQQAKRRIDELEMILQMKGFDIRDIPYMLQDFPDMKRARSIDNAKNKWPELF